MPIDTYTALRSITRVLKQVPPQKRGPILHLASLEAQGDCGCPGLDANPKGTIPMPEEPEIDNQPRGGL